MITSHFIWVVGVGLLTAAAIYLSNRFLKRGRPRTSVTHIGWALLALAGVLVVLLNVESGPLAVNSELLRVVLTLVFACAFGAGIVFAKGEQTSAPGEPS